MFKKSLFYFEENSMKQALFLFFGLIVFGSAVFVFAENDATTKDIFADTDQDGLSNEEEKLYGTDPMNKDTDNDGYSDGVEVESSYDPLKPAPGDKLFQEESGVQNTEVASTQADEMNLTEKVSNEIAGMIQDTNESGEAISLEDINVSVNSILSGNAEEIILPEIKKEDIKIKKLPKNLSDKKRLEREKKDALEYLTVVSYLVANNSPKDFQTQSDFSAILNNLSLESVTGLASGNTQSLEDLSKRGEKMLTELKDIEVPEKMLDVHIKALQMAQYAVQLKQELKPNDTDPLGQIAVLSKAQGFFGSVAELVVEIQTKLADYGIEEIPLSL
ncbi:MAG: hypothetical protein PHH40_03745 [Candidatus Moranbacteria bacterium]|nr:hypothetical protein [Candidatus Moranbacteria bacterium]MDD3964640.1 hypothetical protein [Candidatus Moranbacteria bacterium]